MWVTSYLLGRTFRSPAALPSHTDNTFSAIVYHFFLTMCYRGIIDCYLWEEGERLLGLIVRSSLCIDMAIWHYTFHMQERRSMICSNILYI